MASSNCLLISCNLAPGPFCNSVCGTNFVQSNWAKSAHQTVGPFSVSSARPEWANIHVGRFLRFDKHSLVQLKLSQQAAAVLPNIVLVLPSGFSSDLSHAKHSLELPAVAANQKDWNSSLSSLYWAFTAKVVLGLQSCRATAVVGGLP